MNENIKGSLKFFKLCLKAAHEANSPDIYEHYFYMLRFLYIQNELANFWGSNHWNSMNPTGIESALKDFCSMSIVICLDHKTDDLLKVILDQGSDFARRQMGSKTNPELYEPVSQDLDQLTDEQKLHLGKIARETNKLYDDIVF